MTFDDEGSPLLQGDGSFGFQVIVDGDDLVVRGARATWFGGNFDPDDSGETASGVNTRDNPGCMGCSLPMDFGPCSGSPIPRIPWQNQVRVFSHATQEIITVPVIDLGPNKPPRAHAQLDLTIAAFEALGVSHEAGEMKVDYRILGGAEHLSQAVKDAIASRGG